MNERREQRKLDREQERQEREQRRQDPAWQQQRKETRNRRWNIAKQWLGLGLGFVLRFFGIALPQPGALKNENNIFLNQNNATMKSQFARLNGKDFGKGLLLTVLVVIVGGVQNTIGDGTLPTGPEMAQIGSAALSAAIAYVVKNFFTNSADQFLTGEKK